MKELTVDAAVENIEVVTDFVNEELEKLDCPVKARRQIDVAIDELFGNIARYAYSPDVGKATVRFSVEENPLEVTILVKKSMDLVEYEYKNGQNILKIKKKIG